MNKAKMSSGLAAIILLASMLVGWQTLLLVAILMLLFCEMNDAIKNAMVRIVTFSVAVLLVRLGWNLIVGAVDVVESSIDNLIALLNSYLTEPIDITKLELYLLNPIDIVVNICDNIVDYLILFAEFTFAIAILGNKAMKENFIVRKINDFVTKAINFINSYEVMPQAPVAQAQPTVNTMGMPMSNQNVNSQNNPNNLGM